MSDTNFDPKSRYYDAGGIEVQEIIRAKLTSEQYQGFCLGNIIKYSCRANFKGDFKRDMEKVGFYQSFLDKANSQQRVIHGSLADQFSIMADATGEAII